MTANHDAMSNTSGLIAELRRRIATNKGKASRAHSTAAELAFKAREYERQIAADQREIEAMGGKVRR